MGPLSLTRLRLARLAAVVGDSSESGLRAGSVAVVERLVSSVHVFSLSSTMSSKNTKLLFTPEEDEKLLEAIAPHPAIYDLKNSLYKDQRAKDNVWLVISSEVGRPVADCKRRWKNIKDTHDRRTRECNKTGSEAPPSSKKRKWELQEKLSFLYSSADLRRSFCNIDETISNEGDIDIPTKSNDVEVDDPAGSYSQAETPPAIVAARALSPNESPCNVLPKQTKKMNYREKMCVVIDKRSQDRDAMMKKMFENDDESDDISLFYKSIAKTVLKFHPHLQQRAKLETLSLISKIESDMWSSRSGISSHSQYNAITSPSPSSNSVQSQFTTNSASTNQHEEDYDLANDDIWSI